jgi:hypothetical protein
MTVRERLTALALIVVEEAERNQSFRRRLEAVFGPAQSDLPLRRDDKTSSPKKSQPSWVPFEALKKGGRRTPAVLDPISIARTGEDALRQKLSGLDIEQLKDVVAQYGMDPGKLVMKWKDSARVIDKIVEMSMARSTKGDAFRADKPPAETPVGPHKEFPAEPAAKATDDKGADKPKQ